MTEHKMINRNDIPVKDRLADYLAQHPVSPDTETYEILQGLLAEKDHRGAYFLVRGIITLEEARNRDY